MTREKRAHIIVTEREYAGILTAAEFLAQRVETYGQDEADRMQEADLRAVERVLGKCRSHGLVTPRRHA